MYKCCLLLLIAGSLIVSCKSPHKKQAHAPSIARAKKSAPIFNAVTDTFAVNNPRLREFRRFLDGLDLSETDNATIGAKKFGDLFKNDDAKTRDTAFILFNKFDLKLAENADVLHDRDTTIEYDSLVVDSSGKQGLAMSNKTALYGSKLKANGLRVVSSEGDTYIVQDMDF